MLKERMQELIKFKTVYKVVNIILSDLMNNCQNAPYVKGN